MSHDSKHALNLPLFFFLLLIFTAAEVGLFEFWRQSGTQGERFVSKFVLVLLVFAFTIPKAFIVLTYFMHLRFERSLVVLIALVPFFMVALMVLTVLSDIRTLSPRQYGQAVNLADYALEHGGQAHHDGDGEHDEPAEDETEQ